MYTLCPQCSFVHRLGAAELAPHSGTVRCVRCDKTFNALDRLYDDYPDGNKPAHRRDANADIPEVGRKPAPSMPAKVLEPPVQPKPLRWPWILAVSVLAVATVVNLTWTLREAIPKDGPIAKTLHRFSVPGFEPPPPFRDPSRIHLLSRDIHDHPTRNGVLVLSATFVNLADQAQPYPQLTVTLLDSDDRAIAARQFNPVDYLLRAPGADALLEPDQQVPILLEFADPGTRATGFELQFH